MTDPEAHITAAPDHATTPAGVVTRSIITTCAAASAAPPPTLTPQELDALQQAALALPIPDGLLDAVATLRRDLAAKGIAASDRRWRQSLTLLRAHALIEWRGIVEEDGGIVIGAMTTHAELAASPVLAAKCPLFARTAPQIGDVQVRNKGTIGGSLAHADPAADWPPVVLALDAELEIAAASGSRWRTAARARCPTR